MNKEKLVKESGSVARLFEPGEVFYTKQKTEEVSDMQRALSDGQDGKSKIVPLKGTEIVAVKGAEEPLDLQLSVEVERQILKIEARMEYLIMNMKSGGFELGKLIYQAKQILPHGAFQPWIEERWKGELPYSTAHRLMKIYERFRYRPNVVRKLPLSFLSLMTQDEFPEVIRKLAEEYPEDLDRNKIRGIRSVYQDFKNGNISEDESVEIAKQIIELGEAVASGEFLVRASRMTKRNAMNAITGLKNSINNLRKYVGRTFDWFPPADENYSKETEETTYFRKAGVLAGLSDREVLDGIDYCIAELNKLRREIEGRDRMIKKRLVEENGIIQEAWIDAKKK